MINENQASNVDQDTVRGFGDEWTRFTQDGLSNDEKLRIFNDYFSMFPWDILPSESVGSDIGCGSGRWASLVAPRVGKLYLIDASSSALEVAKKNLQSFNNVIFKNCSVSNMPIDDSSLDFAYSLGVLHHVPDTELAIQSISKKLKKGAPFLLYLYYNFENRGFLFKKIWQISEIFRLFISRLPMPVRFCFSQIIALTVYLPLARFISLLNSFNLNTENLPLNCYSDKSFYVMRTDALDRFGTRLEQRFSRQKITKMLKNAGFDKIKFSDTAPFWCAISYKS